MTRAILNNKSLRARRRHDLLSLVVGEARGKLEAQAAEYVTDDNVLRRALLSWAAELQKCFACRSQGKRRHCPVLCAQHHACRQLASGSLRACSLLACNPSLRQACT